MNNLIINAFDPHKSRAERESRQAAYEALTPFDKFWAHCPRKVGKAIANVRFDEIIQGMTTRTLDRDSGQYVDLVLKATAEQLIEGMKRYASECEGIETRYQLHPATFLNRGRWEDYE